MPTKTQIIVSPSAIILQIPESDADRAKKTEGGKWDASAEMWVYPYDEQTLEELIREFGDQLDDLKFDATGRRKNVRPETIDEAEAETDGGETDEEATLDEEEPNTDDGETDEEPKLEHGHPEFEQVVEILKVLREKLDHLPTVEYVKTVVNNGIETVCANTEEVKANTEEVKERVTDLLERKSRDRGLKEALRRREQELASEKEETSKLKKDLEASKECVSGLEAEVAKRRSEVVQFKRDIKNIKENFVAETVLEIAKRVSGYNEDFVSEIEKTDIKLFKEYPTILAGHTIRRLEKIVEKNNGGAPLDGRSTRLASLLENRYVWKMFSDEERNAAHFLRYRRNEASHLVEKKRGDTISPEELEALAISSIIAASIYWGKLSMEYKKAINKDRK